MRYTVFDAVPGRKFVFCPTSATHAVQRQPFQASVGPSGGKPLISRARAVPAVMASILASMMTSLTAQALRPSGIMGLLEPQTQALVPGPLEAEYRIEASDGRPLPFASYRLVSGEGGEASGVSYADGVFIASAGALYIRAEISARGAARVIDLRGDAAPRRAFILNGASPLTLPLACDVVFILDATASMKPYADAIKLAIESLGRNLRTDTRVRFGFILLGEREGRALLDTRVLSASMEDFNAALGAFNASGGDDDAEPLEAALAQAISGMAWEMNAVKAVFLFTDAEAKDPGAYAAVHSAREAGANIYAVAFGNMPAAGEAYLRSVVSGTRGAYIPAWMGRSPRLKGSSAAALPIEDVMLSLLRSEISAASGDADPGRRKSDPALALLEEAQRKMAFLLSYPEEARLRRASGVATLALSVSADGKLAGAEISSSSGSAILDKAALALAKASFPIGNPSGVKAELFISVKYVLEPGEGDGPGSPEPAPPSP
jgi:TonB family protein